MNTTISNYFENGCGRCSLGGTPDCKVHKWTEEMQFVRSILLESELVEEVKWGVPCYTYQNSNILILSAFVNYCSLSFFKGSLLKDPNKILTAPGPNSRHAKLLKFDKNQAPQNFVTEINDFIQQAIQLEINGVKVDAIKPQENNTIEELEVFFDKDPAFKAAFEALTPGRQRGYLIYFSAPKQSKTRISRIEKYQEQIFNGVGLHDKYQGMKKKK